jgi:hypothetical protein
MMDRYETTERLDTLKCFLSDQKDDMTKFAIAHPSHKDIIQYGQRQMLAKTAFIMALDSGEFRIT